MDGKYRMKVEEVDGQLMMGGQPVLLIEDNETSRAYAKALAENIAERDKNHTYGGLPLRIYAAQPFQDGALLLVSSDAMMDRPALYYMEEDEIKAANYYAGNLLNYTYFMDHTIYYGLMYPGFESEKLSRGFAHRIEASFSNGDTQSAECKPYPFIYENAPNGEYAGGYMLVTEGKAWLEDVTFYDGDGNVDMDTEAITSESWHKWLENSIPVEMQEDYRADLDSLEGTGINKLLLQTALVPFPDKGTEYSDKEWYVYILYYSDDGIGIRRELLGDGYDIRYLWRNADMLTNMRYNTIPAGAQLECKKFRNTMDDALSSTFKEYKREDGEDQDIQLHWIDLSLDNGTVTDFEALAIESNTAPEKPGLYCVYDQQDGDYLYACVVVE